LTNVFFHIILLAHGQAYLGRKGGTGEKLRDAEDENTPNAALIDFLAAISFLVAPPSAEWTCNRLSFTAKFKKAKYKTETDGALRTFCPSKNNSNVLIITEVKRRERNKRTELIQMQESAEMAAWMLRTSPNLELFNGHCILIAQDRHEIFLVFASCHADYLKYLKGGDITPHAFLTMESYGPWDI
jgi:hypothetical protein